ncbi:MAG: hypothetical protein KDA60_16260, partial [Planctomycetales bacterium]|nr:hypothetical protein [Planctomycetales bacterium]
FDGASTVEPLESRVMLAGSIRVLVNRAGDITIRGDGRSNYVEVAAETVDRNGDGDTDDIVIRGLNDSWGSPTTIRDGRSYVNEVVLNATNHRISQKVSVILGGGNDFISFQGITMSSGLRCITGGGNDSLGLFDTTIIGPTSISTGGGNDYTNIVDTLFRGGVAVNTSGGADYIGLSGLSIAPGFTASFVTAGSPDIIFIGNSVVNGNVYVNTGSLIDTIYVGDGSVFNGGVTVDMGSQFDLLAIENQVELNGAVDVRGNRGGYYTNQLFLYDDSPFINHIPNGIHDFEVTRWTISGVDNYVGLDLPTTLSRWVMDIYGSPVINVVDALAGANMARGFDYATLPHPNFGSEPNPAELKADINSFLNSSQYYLYQKLFLKFLFQQEVTQFKWYNNGL